MGFFEWMAGCRSEKPMPKPFGLPEPIKPRLRMLCGKHVWRCEGGGVQYCATTFESAYSGWSCMRSFMPR